MEYSYKKSRHRGSFIFCAVILIAIGCGAAYAVRCSSDSDLHTSDQPVQVNKQYDERDKKNEEEDWRLVLVNRENPLNQTSDMELTELSNGQKVDTRIYPYLQKMFEDMRSEGIYPVVVSGYRTESEQQQIYNDKIAEFVADGLTEYEAKKEAERWVAIPGTSEHQLGLGVDINADGINSYGYEVYEWLEDNAHRYGFIHRYPDDKTDITGIANEPWHYRYVGQKAADEIHRRGICLEEYLEGK